MRDAEQTVGNLIDKQKVAYIASVHDDGFPNIKAMLSPRKREGIKTFYFSTNTSSMRVKQYRQNAKASIYFCDKRFYRGVMLTGMIEVLEDHHSKQMIWQAGGHIVLPFGRNRPGLLCLEVYSLFRPILQ